MQEMHPEPDPEHSRWRKTFLGPYYGLDEKPFTGTPRECALAWNELMLSPDSIIALAREGDIITATTFAGMDLSYGVSEIPLLYQTRVAGGGLNGAGENTSTIDLALEAHARWVQRAKGNTR